MCSLSLGVRVSVLCKYNLGKGGPPETSDDSRCCVWRRPNSPMWGRGWWVCPRWACGHIPACANISQALFSDQVLILNIQLKTTSSLYIGVSAFLTHSRELACTKFLLILMLYSVNFTKQSIASGLVKCILLRAKRKPLPLREHKEKNLRPHTNLTTSIGKN